jgi:hypothetical protein
MTLFRKEHIIMKNEWNNPVLDELSISLTANGATPNDQHDGDWIQISDNPPEWVKPGCSR